MTDAIWQESVKNVGKTLRQYLYWQQGVNKMKRHYSESTLPDHGRRKIAILKQALKREREAMEEEEMKFNLYLWSKGIK